MTFLRRVLKVQAAVWAVVGVLLATVPVFVVDGLLGQPVPADQAWLRLSGVMAAVLAMLMVLVAQRVAEVWWWAWAFALLEAGNATVFWLHAVFGVPSGAAVWPWWIGGAASAAFGALDLVGLALAGNERAAA